MRLAILAGTPRSDRSRNLAGSGPPKLHKSHASNSLAGKHGGRRSTERRLGASGAALRRFSLMTAWTQDDTILVALQLRQPGLRIETPAVEWRLRDVGQLEKCPVILNGVPAVAVGGSRRVWRPVPVLAGRCRIAAVWYGATVAIRKSTLPQIFESCHDPHAAAHLGAMDQHLARRPCAAHPKPPTWIDTIQWAEHQVQPRCACEPLWNQRPTTSLQRHGGHWAGTAL